MANKLFMEQSTKDGTTGLKVAGPLGFVNDIQDIDKMGGFVLD